MNITFNDKNLDKSFTLSPTQHYENKPAHIWLNNESGEGGQFPSDEVSNVIYEALEKYFKDNH